MAVSALEVLNLTSHIAEELDPAVFVPAVGQGAIAIECRNDSSQVLEALAGINDETTATEVTIERAYLGELGADALPQLEPTSREDCSPLSSAVVSRISEYQSNSLVISSETSPQLERSPMRPGPRSGCETFTMSDGLLKVVELLPLDPMPATWNDALNITGLRLCTFRSPTSWMSV